jgi:hypothetical protein
MTPDDRLELEGLVKGLQALIGRLERHRQPLAKQLLEMAVIELKRRIHDIDDDEFAALVDTVSGRRPSNDLSQEAEPAQFSEKQPEGPGKTTSSPRVVIALSEVGRSKRKRRT